ncbi:MAG: 4'-phosphopantetheinyl transferase superfamily protein [Sinobacteraceae bacterium]|nr:4'-phosphopantetheinyl transferase superfamily protein [Nevskiaceae bacterium]
MLTATPAEVHLWFIFCNEVRDASMLARYRGTLLSRSEAAREATFHRGEDRHRYLLTRAAIRCILSEYAPIAPAKWTFVTDEHGRPWLTDVPEAARRVSFNISHTDGIILIAITADAALGVDVEWHDTRTDRMALAERYFAPAEAASLRRLPAERQLAAFFDLWTLKEAYIKARGSGLSIPLCKFCFALDDSHIQFGADPSIDSDASQWRFWLLHPATEHSAAVCVSGVGPHRLVSRKMVPLQGYQPFPCTTQAASGARVG